MKLIQEIQNIVPKKHGNQSTRGLIKREKTHLTLKYHGAGGHKISAAFHTKRRFHQSGSPHFQAPFGKVT